MVVEQRETVLELVVKSLQSLRLSRNSEFGIHGMVVDKRETVLDLMAKSVQSLRLSRNSWHAGRTA